MLRFFRVILLLVLLFPAKGEGGLIDLKNSSANYLVEVSGFSNDTDGAIALQTSPDSLSPTSDSQSNEDDSEEEDNKEDADEEEAAENDKQSNEILPFKQNSRILTPLLNNNSSFVNNSSNRNITWVHQISATNKNSTNNSTSFDINMRTAHKNDKAPYNQFTGQPSQMSFVNNTFTQMQGPVSLQRPVQLSPNAMYNSSILPSNLPLKVSFAYPQQQRVNEFEVLPANRTKNTIGQYGMTAGNTGMHYTLPRKVNYNIQTASLQNQQRQQKTSTETKETTSQLTAKQKQGGKESSTPMSNKTPNKYEVLSNERADKPADHAGNGKLKMKKVKNSNHRATSSNKKQSSKEKQSTSSRHSVRGKNANKMDDTKEEDLDETRIALKLGTNKASSKNKNKEVKPNKNKEENKQQSPEKQNNSRKNKQDNSAKTMEEKKMKNRKKKGGKSKDETKTTQEEESKNEENKDEDKSRGVTIEDGYEGIVKVKKPTHKNNKEKTQNKNSSTNNEEALSKTAGKKKKGENNSDQNKNKGEKGVLKIQKPSLNKKKQTPKDNSSKSKSSSNKGVLKIPKPTDNPTDSDKAKQQEDSKSNNKTSSEASDDNNKDDDEKQDNSNDQNIQKIDNTVNESNEKEQQENEDSKIKNKKQDVSAVAVGSLLSKLRFMNGASGHVTKDQQFSYISQCGLYTEPQNVSAIQRAWVTKTYTPYFYLYEKPKNYEQCKTSEWMHDKEMRGSVFLSFEVKSLRGSNMTNNAKICEKYCCKEPRCAAWTLRFQEATTSNCPENSFCCWLKNAVPPVEDHEAAISGVVHRKNYKHPPTGMRSAVPLGGLGTGSFEMRADGTFHEWTIENQSPGGSAKLGKTALEKIFLGTRVVKGDKEPVSAVLKTHVPTGFENDSVSSMEYFGAHPVSKFNIDIAESLKEDIEMSLYAYSPFHPRDEALSATPATAFSLLLKNPSKSDQLDVSFMMNLPFGYNEDTIRKGGNYQEKQFSRLVTPSDCMNACAERVDCQAWTTNGPYACMLKDTIPLHSYDYGIISGIRGNWSVEDGMLNCERPGFSPQSGSISLYPLQSGSELTSFTVTDDVENMWKVFKNTGHVDNRTEKDNMNSTGLHGAVSLGTKLKPGESKVLTIVFSWYFPNRDIADERVGNFYANLFQSSKDVAKTFENDLERSLEEIVRWQSVFFPPLSLNNNQQKKKDRKELEKEQERIEPAVNCTDTSNGVKILPTCLQDIMVNSMSFLRTGMWMEDGRWRQWEAFDCANMDPVHIDFHRILPYMIFYPELVKQIMLSWANHQLSNIENGMIQESLSVGCLEETSKEGVAGGRLMADVNVAFIAQAYLIQIWTNDTDFFNVIYPYTVRASHWLMKRATKNTELPFRKPDTYDLFELDKYDHCAYNSILYFLALRVMKKMALLKKDTKTLHDVSEALKRGEKRFDIEFWDEKKGFYHAWFDDEWGSPSWLMTDILYGQVWAYTLGIGDLVDQDKMESHLKKEVDRNDSPFGLKVMTKSEESNTVEDTSVILGEEVNSCKSLENITKTNSVWMSSSTDWSSLQLYLGMEPKKAMEQAIKSLDNYRTNLRDMWNFHGITSSSKYGLDGLPWATSHYTLHLVLWHLPIALSGQQYYAPNGSLSFNPKYEAPYWLPFYIPSCMGNIEAKETKGDRVEILYTLKVSSGNCKFNELSISNVKYSEPIELSAGDEISWSTPKLSKKEIIKSILDQLKH